MTALYPNVFESYEQKRDQLAAWAAKHYIAEFDLEPCRLLDAACGEGFWADVFTDAGFSAYGFDREPEYVAAGQKKYPRVMLQPGDALGELPYPPGSFGVVFVRAISCFYSYRLTEARKVLVNLLPLVKPGGLLLMSVYSDGSGEKRPGMFGGGHWHHPHNAYLDLAAAVGAVKHSAAKGNYLQIAVTR